MLIAAIGRSFIFQIIYIYINYNGMLQVRLVDPFTFDRKPDKYVYILETDSLLIKTLIGWTCTKYKFSNNVHLEA